MDFRKFYFILCIVTSVLLFIAGSIILAYLNIPFTSNVAVEGRGSLLSDMLDPLKAENKAVNFLILGGDQVAGNSDTIMLVNYNPSTSKINIMSIPRDTRIEVQGSSIDKINSAYPAGGGKLAVETVSNLLNVNISYYIYIDTKAFREIIDLLGGVDFYVPVDMDYEDPEQNLYIHLKKGQQHLNGEQAEQFMRFRQPNYYTDEIWEYYDGSDIKRIEAQQNFIKELIRQKANIFSISKIDDIINVIFSSLDTNMSLSEALKMATGLVELNVNDVNMLRLPGEPAYDELWYFYPDENEAQKIVKEYFNSKDGFKEKDPSKTKKIYIKRTPPSNAEETSAELPRDVDGAPSASVSSTPRPTPARTPYRSSGNMYNNTGVSSDFINDNPSNDDSSYYDSVDEYMP